MEQDFIEVLEVSGACLANLGHTNFQFYDGNSIIEDCRDRLEMPRLLLSLNLSLIVSRKSVLPGRAHPGSHPKAVQLSHDASTAAPAFSIEHYAQAVPRSLKVFRIFDHIADTINSHPYFV